jgi:hypothetical protein
MYPSPDILEQLVHDRQVARQAAAAANRLAVFSPVRVRMARTLRRAADRLDTATASAVSSGTSRRPSSAS